MLMIFVCVMVVIVVFVGGLVQVVVQMFFGCFDDVVNLVFIGLFGVLLVFIVDLLDSMENVVLYIFNLVLGQVVWFESQGYVVGGIDFYVLFFVGVGGMVIFV